MTAPRPTTPTGARIVDTVLPLRRPYRSGTTSMAERRILLVAVGDGSAVGWGECGPVPGYSPETLDECRSWLGSALTAAIEGATPGGGPATAAFALETALADLALAHAGLPLWRHLGGTGAPVEVGAVIGLDPPVDRLPAIATALAAEDYRRIKLKIDAERNTERVAAVRAVLPDHDLAVDANGTLDPGDPATAAALDRFDLSFIEQPFPADDLESHRLLTASIDTPVCLDESVDGVATASRAIDAGAGSVLNLKPARVGGMAEAVAVHDLALSAGWSLWCGGMLENGIGKAAALAIASLPGMSLPADLAPVSHHFAEDLAAPTLTMEHGAIRLPDTPGLGVVPDPIALARFAVSSEAFGDDVGLPV